MKFIRAHEEKDHASFYLYVPKKHVKGRILVAVHGISRNAKEIVERFQEQADRTGTILVVPYFKHSLFRDYQRLGREGKGERADLALIHILAGAGKQLGMKIGKIFMYGNSGGAQFVHRFVMAHPDRVEKYAISAAGWYTPPDVSKTFPYGFKATTELEGVEFDIDRFLRVPACVLVGDKDNIQDPALNTSPRITNVQGRNRLERAKWWTEATTTAARWRSYKTSFRLIIMPDVDHDFTEMVIKGKLDSTVFECLF